MKVFQKICLFLFLVVLSTMPTNGQNSNSNNLDTIYQQYRQRLRQKFVVVDSCVENQGVNIPAISICHKTNTTEWGDANSNLSHYLSLLATEYAVNKKNGTENRRTLSEILYTMLAFERLDLYSEAYLRSSWKMEGTDSQIHVYPERDVNGFHIRDDISSEFWEKHKFHFQTDSFQSVYTNSKRQAISQDNIIHHLEGLALVSVLVGKVSVKDIAVCFNTPLISNYLQENKVWIGDSVDFRLWVADITRRYVQLMQNPVKKRFPYRHFGVKTHWHLSDPIQNQLVLEGSGSDFDLALFFQFGFMEAARFLTGKDLRNYHGLSPTKGFIFKYLMRNRQIKLPSIIPDIPIRFDDYKLRSLATTSNAMGQETYWLLIHYRNTAPVFTYEHFPLIWLLLHDNEEKIRKRNPVFFAAEKKYYEKLFADVPPEGPTSLNSKDWRSVSRCVWPENLPKHWYYDKEFSGMDFMMLYNMYKLIFQ
jgi:hypothetical protein